jgi:hypothetical protein
VIVSLPQITIITRDIEESLPPASRQKREMFSVTTDSKFPTLPHRYDLVWAETVNAYHEMMDSEGWTSQKSFSVASVNPLMSKVSLIYRNLSYER